MVIFDGAVDLSVGATTDKSGLYFDTSTDGSEAYAYVPLKGITSTQIRELSMPHIKPKVHMTPSEEGILCSEIPRQILTSENLAAAPEIVSRSIKAGAWVFGEKAIAAFYTAATEVKQITRNTSIGARERELTHQALLALGNHVLDELAQ